MLVVIIYKLGTYDVREPSHRLADCIRRTSVAGVTMINHSCSHAFSAVLPEHFRLREHATIMTGNIRLSLRTGSRLGPLFPRLLHDENDDTHNHDDEHNPNYGAQDDRQNRQNLWSSCNGKKNNMSRCTPSNNIVSGHRWLK